MLHHLHLICTLLPSAETRFVLPSNSPPQDGGPPEDIQQLLRSQGPGAQRLGDASPVFTLVMERRQLSRPRSEAEGASAMAASEADPSVSNIWGSKASVSSSEPDALILPSNGGYSSSTSSKDSGSPAVSSGNKESSAKASADFDLSTLLITDNASQAAPSSVSVVSENNSSVFPDSEPKPSRILNIFDAKANAFPLVIQNTATDAFGFDDDDAADETTATTAEDLQGPRTDAVNVGNDALAEDVLTVAADGYDLTENLLSSSLESDPLEQIQTDLSTLSADENLGTSTDGEIFTVSSGDEEDPETPASASAFLVDEGLASPARPRGQDPTADSSGDPLPTRRDGDPALSSGVPFPASEREDSDPSASQISADYVPLGDYESSGDPNPREDFAFFGQRNDFYQDDDFALQVLGGDQFDGTTVGGRVDPWGENAGDSGEEAQEKDLYFVLERDPEDAGLVSVKLGKSQEAGRARANENGPLDERYYADNLYQYHLQDHKTGEQESSWNIDIQGSSSIYYELPTTNVIE